MSTPVYPFKNGYKIRFEPDGAWEQALSGQRVCIRTFGCAYNTGDSDLLASVLKNQGAIMVSDPSMADAVILNTCIVIDSTERKMCKEIAAYPGREVYVTGCLPLGRPALLENLAHIKVIHPDSVHRAAAGIPYSHEGAVSVVQIGPGCVGFCRYCITRCARGTIRSIPPGVIYKRIVGDARGGAVEIRLAGQDLSAYGRDTGDKTLATLLEGVPPLTEPARIRLGMMNPATLLPIAQKVAHAMKHGPFFSFLHLPVQSGSDHVLDLMGRGYRVADILKILEIFRSDMPEIRIATDIITGYPGETSEDHLQTRELIRQISPAMVNVTRYSWRPGTGMTRANELPDRIRKDRSREIIREAYAMLHEKNEQKIGTVMTGVVTERIRPGSVMARSRSYEGIVIQENILPGISCTVLITGCTPHYLIGQPVRD
ncbi:MAG TPA: radical SAM protein [Methanospirillum sp.]|uniref:radical SAM protein n=2 Tax=Methanospirillum sp. TaxID=45200 RepID=UPI002CA7CC8B|nr:radical SAM protein [Methanospirillum sp.]HOJ95673.1 radical SAM protein [Methanospirillum sp.]